MDMTKVNAGIETAKAWCKAHPLAVQYGVCIFFGFVLGKCVF